MSLKHLHIRSFPLGAASQKYLMNYLMHLICHWISKLDLGEGLICHLRRMFDLSLDFEAAAVERRSMPAASQAQQQASWEQSSQCTQCTKGRVSKMRANHHTPAPLATNRMKSHSRFETSCLDHASFQDGVAELKMPVS